MAIDDAGALAISWITTNGSGDGANECSCASRVAVLPANSRSAHVTELARTTGSEKEIAGLRLSQSGQAHVLWRERERLKLSTTSSQGRRAATVVIDPGRAPTPGGSALLDEVRGEPVVIYPDADETNENSRETPLYATRYPFTSASRFGAIPSLDWLDGTDFAGNGEGTTCWFPQRGTMAFSRGSPDERDRPSRHGRRSCP